MSSEFLAQKIRSVWSPLLLIKKVLGFIRELGWILLQPLIAYESRSRGPCKALPEETEEIADEQLALCQAIFDQSEARGVHIEQKAQWIFTAMAFLMPVLASIFLFLIRDPAFREEDYHVSLMFLFLSACLLVLSIISVLRAIAIRGREYLGIHAVIKEEDGTFLKYDKHFHAQGLLYCATMNTATNDHIAQFVKGAHWLLALAVIFFVSGAIIAGYQIIKAADKTESCGFLICFP